MEIICNAVAILVLRHAKTPLYLQFFSRSIHYLACKRNPVLFMLLTKYINTANICKYITQNIQFQCLMQWYVFSYWWRHGRNQNKSERHNMNPSKLYERSVETFL
jgi:hypothetical protein